MRLLLQIMKKPKQTKKKQNNGISAIKKQREKDGNKKIKQSNKTLGGYIKGLREHLTTAPGKTAVRMVLAGIQKLIILHTLLK